MSMIGDEIWRSTGRGPTIAKLHAKREHLGIFLPIFEEDICDMLTATQQNYVCIFGILMLDSWFLYLINDHFYSNGHLCIFFSFEKKSKWMY